MGKLHVLLLSTLILNAAIVIGCARHVVDRPNTLTTGTDRYLNNQSVLYREEAAELRAAAQYYEAEAQRSAEAGQESERARRYRDFAQQAWMQADEADRRADESSGS